MKFGKWVPVNEMLEIDTWSVTL